MSASLKRRAPTGSATKPKPKPKLHAKKKLSKRQRRAQRDKIKRVAKVSTSDSSMVTAPKTQEKVTKKMKTEGGRPVKANEILSKPPNIKSTSTEKAVDKNTKKNKNKKASTSAVTVSAKPTQQNKLSKKSADKTVRVTNKAKKKKTFKTKSKSPAGVNPATTQTEASKSDNLAPSKKKKGKSDAEPVDLTVVDSNWEKLAKEIGAVGKKKKPNNEELEESKKSQEAQSPPEPTETDEKKKEMWFDDVDEYLLDPEMRSIELQEEEVPLPKLSAQCDKDLAALEDAQFVTGKNRGLTKYLAMDCEMVGVGSGKESALARISVVNQYGRCVYDTFVKPKEEVVDYRTWVSGVRKKDLETAKELEQVQKDFDTLIKGRILVGHALSNDQKVLFMHHSKRMIRDTQKYKPYQTLCKRGKPGLKMLTQKVLRVKIQSGEHSSVVDAQATMRLFMLVRKEWEKQLQIKDPKLRLKTKSKQKAVKNKPVNTFTGD